MISPLEDTARFDGLRLTATAVQATARRGGPLGGATASLRPCPAGSFGQRLRSWSGPRRRDGAGVGVEVVIDAPTWTLRHRVGPGREPAAAVFVARVNAAVTQAAAVNWWPTPTAAAAAI